MPLRRSAESVYNMPVVRRYNVPRPRSQGGERSLSFSFGGTNEKAILSPSTMDHAAILQRERTPLAYPALLSKVADVFRERVTLGNRMKDSIEYPNVFDGREAVVRSCYIVAIRLRY